MMPHGIFNKVTRIDKTTKKELFNTQHHTATVEFPLGYDSLVVSLFGNVVMDDSFGTLTGYSCFS